MATAGLDLIWTAFKRRPVPVIAPHNWWIWSMTTPLTSRLTTRTESAVSESRRLRYHAPYSAKLAAH